MAQVSYQGPHQGHIKTLRKQKQGAPKDGGSGPSHIRTAYGQVRCDVHGNRQIKGLAGKFLTVSIPPTKREKYSGCPFCNE